MLKRLALEVLFVVAVCSVVTSARGRNKRADIGSMLKTLLSKIMGSEVNTTITPATSKATITSSGNSSTLTNGTILNTANASQTQSFTNSSINISPIPTGGLNGTAVTSKPPYTAVSTKRNSSPTTTMWPATTSSPYRSASTTTHSHTWSTKAREPGLCYINPYLDKFCSVPAILKGVSFWDLYSTMFSDTVLDAMLLKCRKGEWCLSDRFDYWDALIAERVDIIRKSDISGAMCEDNVRMCVARVPANYSSCSVQRFKQMIYTSESMSMICRMKKNPDLSQDCYERVLQALHVTLADIIRGVKEGEPISHTGDTCQSAEAHMTKAIICIANTCPAEAYTFRSFPPWEWFTGVVDEMIDHCHLNTSICEALLQKAPMVWMPESMIVGMILICLLTLSVTLFIGIIFWRKYRRNVVLKEGYQQLLNEDEKS